jgi:hypothetical protein
LVTGLEPQVQLHAQQRREQRGTPRLRQLCQVLLNVWLPPRTPSRLELFADRINLGGS